MVTIEVKYYFSDFKSHQSPLSRDVTEGSTLFTTVNGYGDLTLEVVPLLTGSRRNRRVCGGSRMIYESIVRLGSVEGFRGETLGLVVRYPKLIYETLYDPNGIKRKKREGRHTVGRREGTEGPWLETKNVCDHRDGLRKRVGDPVESLTNPVHPTVYQNGNTTLTPVEGRRS